MKGLSEYRGGNFGGMGFYGEDEMVSHGGFSREISRDIYRDTEKIIWVVRGQEPMGRATNYCLYSATLLGRISRYYHLIVSERH